MRKVLVEVAIQLAKRVDKEEEEEHRLGKNCRRFWWPLESPLEQVHSRTMTYYCSLADTLLVSFGWTSEVMHC